MDVSEIITNRIIEKLEQGVIPWKQPWTGVGIPRRWKVNKPYRGINLWLLPPGEYASYKQIVEAGGSIKEEENKKYHISVYWHWTEKELPGQDDVPKNARIKKRMAFPRYSRIWEINTQCTGLKSKVIKEDGEGLEFNPIEEAEVLLASYQNAPTLQEGGNQAYYSPVFDFINMPPKEHFHTIEDYYSCRFHETIHSTGHLSRLHREGVVDLVRFGSEKYAKEELVAEMGASIMCALCGIDNSHLLDNSASYIKGWLSKLKDDKRFIFSAASQAQTAVDYIRKISYEAEPEPEPEAAEEKRKEKEIAVV